MIDWHTHILPGVDDGSRSVDESLSMLKAESSQGTKIVIATPHFYANDETVDSFVKRRGEALELLKSQMDDGMPRILTGAEVRYYPGISRMEELRQLRIEGSKLLLLEMPMCRWTESMVRELYELSGKSGIRIVLAHIDRYLDMQKKSVWDSLYRCGILMQVNASFFGGFTSKRKAISLLEKGKIHFVGSDCHNLTSRPPKIEAAYKLIEKKLGCDYLVQMNEYGMSRLGITICK